MAIVPKTIIDLARKEIAGLAPEGRQIDMIGTLRAAQAAIVGIMVRELGHDSDRSILRRASLRDAFVAVHNAEIAEIKFAPHVARDVSPQPGNGHAIEPQLVDWRRRRLEDEEDS